jgi:hypothetical protein
MECRKYPGSDVERHQPPEYYQGKDKSKIVPALNQAPRHKYVWGRVCTSMHSQPRHQLEVSGHPHALAALLPGKEPTVPIG